MRSRRFALGGCVYRMQLDARHAACHAGIAALATYVAIRSNSPNDTPFMVWTGAHYIHTSNLPQGRCLWLREAIADRALDYAVTMDGDTWCVPSSLLANMSNLAESAQDWSMAIAPVRQGNGKWNLRQLGEDGVTAEHLDIGEKLTSVRPVWGGGFGLVVFRLKWFRKNWPSPEPEKVSITTGEDIEFCRSVRSRGGLILAIPVETSHAAYQFAL